MTGECQHPGRYCVMLDGEIEERGEWFVPRGTATLECTLCGERFTIPMDPPSH